jgi:hypothetical protein
MQCTTSISSSPSNIIINVHYIFQAPFCFSISNWKAVRLYLLSKACYMTGASHAPWCNNRNNIWRGAQLKKAPYCVVIYSLHFLPPKCASCHPVLENLQPMCFPLMWQTNLHTHARARTHTHTHKKNKKQIYSFYILIFVFLNRKWQKYSKSDVNKHSLKLNFS